MRQSKSHQTQPEDQRSFLVDIAKHPVSGVVTRYTRLGVNRYQGNKIQKDLLTRNLINWKPVSTKQGRLKVLILTDKGKSAISDVEIDKIFTKRGSFEHEYAKFKVGEHFRKKGFWVTYEYKLPGGKSVDLVAEKDGNRIAVEIETGKSDVIYNLQKCWKAEFDEIWIVALTKTVKEEIIMKTKKGLFRGNNKILVLADFK